MSQFSADSQGDCLSLNHSGLSCSSTDKNQFPSNTQGQLDMQDPGDQQLLNNQNQNYSGGDTRHNVPNIILTGGYELVFMRPAEVYRTSFKMVHNWSNNWYQNNAYLILKTEMWVDVSVSTEK